MKIAIITDTHFGARKGSKNLHDYFELFYKNVFFPKLEEYGIDTIIHMGDVFDSRKAIDLQTLEWSNRVVFEPLKKYKVYAATGNHDAYYKNTNFVNYMFRDDMISDGIENCVQYIHNFDPEKSRNPFAYFTQIIHYAFLRRIQKEKKQLDIKNKIIEKTGFDEVMTVESGALTGAMSEYNTIKDNIAQKKNR